MKAKANKRNFILMLVAMASIFVLLYIGIQFAIYSIQGYRYSAYNDKLKQLVGHSSLELQKDEATGRFVTVVRVPEAKDSDGILKKYKNLYDINNDLAGWISIDGTVIDYPVVYTAQDSEYYLFRNFNLEEDKHGLPFLEDGSQLRDRHDFIIYAHNKKDGTMFADVIKYGKSDFYSAHPYIRFDTIYEEAIYEVTAAYSIYTDEIYDFSVFTERAGLGPEDSSLVLCTCDHSDNDLRFIVVAKKVESEEL